MHVANKLDKVTYCALCKHTGQHPSLGGNVMQELVWVEDKLQEVAGIIPDLSGKIDRMKANIVLQLVTDIQARPQTISASFVCIAAASKQTTQMQVACAGSGTASPRNASAATKCGCEQDVGATS